MRNVGFRLKKVEKTKPREMQASCQLRSRPSRSQLAPFLFMKNVKTNTHVPVFVSVFLTMPRIDFKLWDRVYALKVICTVQMTFSSFIAILYSYLLVLQYWLSYEDSRTDIWNYKWIVLIVCFADFGLGSLLAAAANLSGVRCRRRIAIWILLEIFLIPFGIFCLVRLHYKLTRSTKKIPTDPHYTRINIVQMVMYICHFFFIAYAIDFAACPSQGPKFYDSRIRPEKVYTQTDPELTTTESRHIKISESLLFQPSTSKFHANSEDNEKEQKQLRNVK